ncbi:MAG: DinB family protein [Ignavibacteriales bacterium]|nr:DinB family protein [Ignavibacteriales bacterium]
MSLPQTTLERLKTQHEVIEVLISGLSDEELRLRPIPNKWSIHENIAHLACYQPRVISRTEKILVEDNPSFDSYIPETDANFSQFLSMSVEKLLANLKSNRIELVKLVSNLTDEQLKRTGTHSKFGKMNILEWTEFFLLHEAHHIYTIFKLIRSIKKS